MPPRKVLQLPKDLVERLQSPEPCPLAVPLLSVDPEGFPHVALLSYAEIFLEQGALYFFPASASRTVSYLEQRPQATLLFIRAEFVYYLKGAVEKVAEEDGYTLFRFRPISVRQDLSPPGEAEVRLKDGIRFELREELACQKKQRRRQWADQVRSRQWSAGPPPEALE